MNQLLKLNPQTKYRVLAAVIPVGFTLCSIIFLTQASSKIKSYQTNIVELNTKTAAYQETQSLHQFISDNRTVLEKMSVSIPNESMMVGVIQDIESVVFNCDSSGSVKLSGQTPVKSGQDLIIPININLVADRSNINTCIASVKDLPYFIQILSTDVQFQSETARLQINARLYVQDPFSGI